MKNIAFYWGNIPYAQFGGIDRVTIVLAEVFQKMGMNIYCIYSGGVERPLPFCFREKFKWENPEAGYEKLENFLVEQQIEVVINQRYQDSSLISNLHRATAYHGIRLFTVIHCMPGFEFLTVHTGVKKWIRQIYNFKLKPLLIRHYNELVSNSDKVILLTKDFESQFLKTYKIVPSNSDKLTVVPNPCTLEGNFCEQKLNKIVVVSRLSEGHKRLSYILKAWKEISKILPTWSLDIVGDGESRATYEEFCRKNKLQNISLCGRQNPTPYYQRASIFLMTSVFEGWGLTNVEAMSYGVVPVVMDSFASIHDIIDDGDNGFITPNDDLKAFQEKVLLLAKNDELRRRMSRAAYEKSLQFSPNLVADRWAKLFDDQC